MATELNTALLENILSTQSKSYEDEAMIALITGTLDGFGLTYSRDEYGNIYVTKGTPPDGQFYPCAVAHMDTVHPIIEGYELRYDIVYKGWDTVNNRPAGVGGDDKVGVYVALELLRTQSFMKACFFRNEETYMNGSNCADIEFFSDVAFVLMADRRGSQDFIRTAYGSVIMSEEFVRDVEPFLREYQYWYCDHGLWTDVWMLHIRGVGVSCANVSCGYHEPHSPTEYIVTDQVLRCYNLFESIFLSLTRTRYTHVMSEHDDTRAQRAEEDREMLLTTMRNWEKTHGQRTSANRL